ncbi:maltose transport system permease protein malF p2 domain-containing protein [Ditylenchus destructor]|nr:maltose transport system permease protein malF p2 domain-containing protein [Ditylenchus destructor]
MRCSTSLRELIAHRAALSQLRLRLPGAEKADALHYLGLREFGPIRPHYEEQSDGALKRLSDGALFKPDEATGYYEGQGAAAGTHLAPGYKVMVGGHNYARMILDPEFRGPFLSIFGWTVTFSLLTVLCATAIGMTLAVLLNWEDLRFRTTYRTLLFLPYAVPGFISILVFKGLFNQNFGEINAILDALFGVRPAWFADPGLARTMLLIVNVWLGYPYIMILCTGLLKAIPSDLYEASALAGAGPLTNFFKITAPLIIKPLSPLLVSAFAFNFNNFVLIALLTDGRPDYLSTKIPAGQTDILVSYTYRIAFRDSGTDFGLAAAISTLIFILVAAMQAGALARLRGTRAAVGLLGDHAVPAAGGGVDLAAAGQLRHRQPDPVDHQPGALAACAGHPLPGGGRLAGAAALPGADLAVELDQGGDDLGAADRRVLDDGGLRLRAAAFPLQGRDPERHAAAADVPAGAGAGGDLRDLRDHRDLRALGYFETIPVEIEENAKVDGGVALAGLPAGAAADGGADSDGGLRAGLHRLHHRVPRGIGAAARGVAPHAGGGLQVLPARPALPVGRLRRRGGAVGTAHHGGVPAGAALDRVGADGGWGEGVRRRVGATRHHAMNASRWAASTGRSICSASDATSP